MHNNSIFHQLFNFIIANFQTAVQFRNQFTGVWTSQTTQANHGRKIVKKRPWTRKKRTRSRKKSRHRTTLPHSVVQYHRREASYRSCSGWEREFQACYRHREKIYKKEGRKAGRRGMLQIQRLLLICWIIVEMWRACLFSWEPSWRTVLKKKGGQASRRISTGKLKTLLFLHIRPIEVVVYDPPSGILLFRDI